MAKITRRAGSFCLDSGNFQSYHYCMFLLVEWYEEFVPIDRLNHMSRYTVLQSKNYQMFPPSHLVYFLRGSMPSPVAVDVVISFSH